MSVTGTKPMLPARAPIVDIITSGDGLADIYSMFRIRKGYAGYCRRVRRYSDNAERDIGFTAGGFYNIKEELLWAAGSDTVLVRWYNQGTDAGASRPNYLMSPSGNTVASVAGAPHQFNGYPAMMVYSDDLAPDTFGTIGSTGHVSAVLIGASSFDGGDAKVFGLHPDGSSAAINIAYYTSQFTDVSIYTGRTAAFSPSAPTGSPYLLTTSSEVASPYSYEAWMNGTPMSVGYRGTVDSVNIGSGRVFGGELMLHTFIVDGNTSKVIHDLAKTSFNARNWIY